MLTQGRSANGHSKTNYFDWKKFEFEANWGNCCGYYGKKYVQDLKRIWSTTTYVFAIHFSRYLNYE